MSANTPTRQHANTLGGYGTRVHTRVYSGVCFSFCLPKPLHAAADDVDEIVELRWRLTGFQENFHTFSACANSVKIGPKRNSSTAGPNDPSFWVHTNEHLDDRCCIRIGEHGACLRSPGSDTFRSQLRSCQLSSGPCSACQVPGAVCIVYVSARLFPRYLSSPDRPRSPLPRGLRGRQRHCSLAALHEILAMNLQGRKLGGESHIVRHDATAIWYQQPAQSRNSNSLGGRRVLGRLAGWATFGTTLFLLVNMEVGTLRSCPLSFSLRLVSGEEEACHPIAGAYHSLIP